MRIGFDTLVENPRSPSSAINYLQSVLRTLVEVGPEHQYFVFVSPKNRHLFNVAAPNAHVVNCWASNENITLRVCAQQLQCGVHARRLKLDVIHALNQIPLFAGCATVVKTCTLHHHLASHELLKDRKGSMMEKWLRIAYRRLMHDASMRQATIVISNSEATKRDIVRLVQIQPEKIRVIFENVGDEFGTVRDVQAARMALQKEYSFDGDYILYVSNLWYYKNPYGAVRAFACQRAKYQDNAYLLVVGQNDYQHLAGLKQMAAHCGVEDRVRFLNRVSYRQLVELYAGARVMFYPSFAETFGKPLVEAMRSGVPVVGSCTTSVPEILGGAGLLVDPKNVEEMADALHKLWRNDTLREELIRLGLNRARQFSWEATAKGTLAVCDEAVKRHRVKQVCRKARSV